jgi:hypothetical protein
MVPETLKQGDQVPGHVAVLVGVEASGKEVLFQAQNLDRPFLGFFYPENAYPEWRRGVLSADEFKRAFPDGQAR